MYISSFIAGIIVTVVVEFVVILVWGLIRGNKK